MTFGPSLPNCKLLCPNTSGKCDPGSKPTLWSRRGGPQNSEVKLSDLSQSARLKELTDLIEKERDLDKFSKFAEELNTLLDEQKKPVKPPE